MSNELDKHFGEQLHAYESDVDAEAIWAAVRPPRRRRPWLWFFLLFTVIAGAGAAWWTMSDQNTSDDLVKQTPQEQQTINAERAIDSDAQHLADNDGENASGEATMAKTTVTTEKQADELQSIAKQQTVTTEERSEVNLQQPASSADQTGNTTTLATAETMPNGVSDEDGLAEEMAKLKGPESDVQVVEKTSGDSNDQDYGTTEISTPASRDQIEERKQDGSAAANTRIDDLAAGQEAEDHKISSTKHEEASPFSETINEELQSATSEVFKTTDFAAIDYRLPTQTGNLSRLRALEKSVVTPELYRRGRRRISPWSMQADGAYLAIRRTLESDSLSRLIALRTGTESVLEAWSTDLTVGYNWHQNWQVRAGLGYTQINTQFALNNTVVRFDSIVGVDTLIFNPNGTVDTLAGPIVVRETIDRERRIYNSFRQWEIPVLVNYEASLGQLSLIAEAGVRLRLSRTWEGQVIVDEEEEVEPWEGQDWYRTDIGVSLQAGLHLGYELSPQLQLRAGATMRYTPADFSTAQSAFKEGYQLGGLQVGLRYQFR